MTSLSHDGIEEYRDDVELPPTAMWLASDGVWYPVPPAIVAAQRLAQMAEAGIDQVTAHAADLLSSHTTKRVARTLVAATAAVALATLSANSAPTAEGPTVPVEHVQPADMGHPSDIVPGQTTEPPFFSQINGTHH